MEKEALGKKILEFRTNAGLSQIELCAAAGISTNTLSNIERGIKYPRKTTLRCILNALGMAQDELP